MDIDEEKYIVFNRSEFRQTLFTDIRERYVGAQIKADIAEDMMTRYEGLSLHDAVVIRRRDAFASPCLLTYATMIAMVAEHHPEKVMKRNLLAIADYFHEQGVLAGEEDSNLPTI